MEPMTTSDYLFDADQRARLAAAEALLDPGTQHLIERLGIAPGWHCLEVGAGGGSIARWLAERTGPRGHVLATDLDVHQLQLSAGPALEVLRHDIVRDELAAGAFNLVHARLLLEHLPARDAVLVKLARALRPGGWLLVESVDYISGVPVSAHGAAEHERTQAVRLAAFARQGIDHELGRQLPGRLRALGLGAVGNEARAWVMAGGSPGAEWFRLSLAHLRGRLVGPGQLTDAEVDRMLELFADPAWSALSPLIVAAWGQAST
jgi:SAM-dependent methyltransferase